MRITALTQQWWHLEVPKGKEKKAAKLAKEGHDIFYIADELGVTDNAYPDDYGAARYEKVDGHTLAIYDDRHKRIWDNSTEPFVYAFFGDKDHVELVKSQKDGWVSELMHGNGDPFTARKYPSGIPPEKLLGEVLDMLDGWGAYYAPLTKEAYLEITKITRT